jgi:serine/threonine protein phosphatase PrpC
MTRFAAGAATDVGQVRSVNQDNTLVSDDVFAVADGMGGHRGGEVASAVAVDALRHHFRERTPMALLAAVREANRAVVERSQRDPELRGMGTTLCALAGVRRADGDELLTIVNVGDSRAYLLKAGEAALIQISEDHSLVQQLVRQGQLSPDAAAVHPQRNILTRALGIDREVKPDAFVVLPVRGDRYLLCSDGLFNEVDERRIAEVLRQTPDPRQAANVLVHLANEGGGRDNISVVVVDVTDDDGRGNVRASEVGGHRVVDIVRFEDQPIEPVSVDPTVAVERPRPNGAPTAGAVPGQGFRGPARPAPGPAGPSPYGPPGRAPGEGPGTGAPAPAGAPTVTVNRAARPADRSGADPTGTTRTPDGGYVIDRPLFSPAQEAPAPAPATNAVMESPAHRSRFTWRVGLFLLVLVAIFASAVYAVTWVADNTYYVGVDGNQVAIFRGKPGGLMWRQPYVEEYVHLPIDEVLTQYQGDVRAGKETATLQAAREYVGRAKNPAPTTTTTTTAPTTTTTTVFDPLQTTTTLAIGP